MKRVVYRNSQGRMEARLLRDEDDPNFPDIGIPIEPPPIERIVTESAQEVQDEIVRRGLFTYKDVVAAQNAITSVLRDVLLRKIMESYKLKELEENAHKPK